MATMNDASKTPTEIAKKIIIKTAEMAIPLTPENYHVWYEYFLGTNEELTAAMTALIASNKVFSQEINEKLYSRYLHQDKKDFLKEVQKETHKIFQTIFQATLSTNNAATDYSGKMQNYSDKLSETNDLNQIQNLVEEIISDTHEMAASSKQLNQQLEKATSQIESLSKQLEETEKEVLLDGLTGLNNRKAFDLKIDALYQGFQNEDDPFSVVMLDIDYFKKFNDQYGHQIGDEVLALVGWHLKENLKGRDFPSRYGGEEFIILLPNTQLDKANIVGDHIRDGISNNRLKIKKTGKTLGSITVSVGVAQIRQGDTAASVVERADAALYLAKDSGRNNVKSEQDL